MDAIEKELVDKIAREIPADDLPQINEWTILVDLCEHYNIESPSSEEDTVGLIKAGLELAAAFRYQYATAMIERRKIVGELS